MALLLCNSIPFQDLSAAITSKLASILNKTLYYVCLFNFYWRRVTQQPQGMNFLEGTGAVPGIPFPLLPV